MNEFVYAAVNAVRQPLAFFELNLVLTALTKDIGREIKLDGLRGEHFKSNLVIKNGLNIQRLLTLHRPANLRRKSFDLALDDLPL